MNDIKEVNSLLNECLDDWPHAATMVCTIMNRIKKAVDILKNYQWIPVTERLPENANHKGAFCPRYRVLTPWGETVGWYNPDNGCWYFLLWYLDGIGVDFNLGDSPKLAHEKPGKTVVTHWMPESINGGKS